ncbi:MAG: tetratricopeptide repeat protein [Verrucomicrobia bacterium]|nr:tetratricopeptide repeat protein [Verrucomicrobiota bacterium]
MNETVNDSLLAALKQADEAGQIALTRHLCEQVLRGRPDHGPTLIRHARCLGELALYGEAARALDHAEGVVAKERLPIVFDRRGHLLELMGDYAGAEQQHLKAHDLDPGDASHLILAAHVAFLRGDIARAVELGCRATACPEGCLDEAWINLGGYRLAERRYEEARQCYRRALEFAPEDPTALERLEDVECVLRDRASSPLGVKSSRDSGPKPPYETPG